MRGISRIILYSATCTGCCTLFKVCSHCIAVHVASLEAWGQKLKRHKLEWQFGHRRATEMSTLATCVCSHCIAVRVASLAAHGPSSMQREAIVRVV